MDFGDRDLSSAIALLARGLEAGDTHAAVQWLGTRRGEDGVGLAAAFDDLTTAYRVAAGLDPAGHELRDLAVAWAEGAIASVDRRGALDPVTGLATRDYLATRLRDLARLRRADAHRLLVIGAGPSLYRLTVLLRAGRLAAELVGTFASAETPVQLSGGRIGALVAADDELAVGMAGLRRAIPRIDAASGAPSAVPAEIELLEPPSTAGAVSAFLDAL